MNSRVAIANRSRYRARRVWITHNGPIPKDSLGYPCEIHHIDGNRMNNDIDNLVCLTIHEHYEIHFWQSDWGACHAISQRGITSPEERSRLGKLAAQAFSGDKHYRFDHTRYEFKHRDTQEVFIGTRADFIKTHDLEFGNVALLVKKKVITVKGWMLAENFGKNIVRPYAFAPTQEYRWQNIKTGEIVVATRNHMAQTYDMSLSHLLIIIKGERDSHKGWTLIRE
jgi:hypothetical protein